MNARQHQDQSKPCAVAIATLTVGSRVLFQVPKGKRNLEEFEHQGRTYKRVGKSRTFTDGEGFAYLNPKDRNRNRRYLEHWVSHKGASPMHPVVLAIVNRFKEEGAIVSPLEVAKCLTRKFEQHGNASDHEGNDISHEVAEEAVYQYFKAWLSRNPLIPTLAPKLEVDQPPELEKPEPPTFETTSPHPPPITLRPTIQPTAPNR